TDILTPIHKTIRSMIYQVAGRLQTTDFTNTTATDQVLKELEYDFTTALYTNCILCFLHGHAGAEEQAVFPPAKAYDSKLIEELLQDHHEFATTQAALSKIGQELQQTSTSVEREAIGKSLTLEANQFFARYLSHLNREEAELVPLLNRQLTENQLMAVRD